MNLFSEFLKNDHRRTGKWVHYFPIYERHLSRFRNQYATLFEIGIADGGSLQLWKRYFGPFVRIVGIDIDPRCKAVEEDQIEVRIGGQDDTAFLAEVIADFGMPDIVVDDGSHVQDHINTTFDFLYPKVAKNGVYLVEDLHTAYWDSFGGGLGRAGTFIERAKSFIDQLNFQHTGGAIPASDFTDRTASLHAYDSVIVLEVGERRAKYDRWIGHAPE